MEKQEQFILNFMEFSRTEQQKVIVKLQKLIKDAPETKQLIKKDTLFCPFCNAEDIIIHGKYKNRKRYKCKKCSKTFTNQSGTPLHNLKKGAKFLEFIDLTLGSEAYLSLKEISNKIGISSKAAFEWRHKLLLSLKIETDKFSDITEIDDIWFLYSQMGRKGLKYSRKQGGARNKPGDNDFQAKILITADRKDHIDTTLIRIGRMSKADIERTIGEKIHKDTILVSDQHASISAFANDFEIKHKVTSKN